MHKTHLKSFIFEILFIRDYSSTFISLMAKFEVYSVFASKLEHFENDIHFCQDTVTLKSEIMHYIGERGFTSTN